MAAFKVVRSEDVVGEKVDKCITDSLVKTGAGAALGIVFSVLLFKRRGWPIAFGLGTGLGMAVSNCQHEFKTINSHMPGTKSDAPKFNAQVPEIATATETTSETE